MKYINATVIAILLASCGEPQSTTGSKLDAEWNSRNNPELISGDYDSIFKDLELSGNVDTLPWSDDYWPTYKGGLSYRWNDRSAEKIGYEAIEEENVRNLTKYEIARLSPAEKYDLFVGYYDFPTVKSERKRTNVLKTIAGSDEFDPDYKIPTWEGLCHGWAPASMNFKEPRSVTLAGANGLEVPFGSSDIKALLTYYQQYKGNRSTKTYFMADRCYDSFKELKEKLDAGEITKEEFDAKRESSSCEDTNAGAFHIVLANEIGKKKESFLVDITRDAEVWNQAVNSYRSVIVGESDKVTEGAAPGTVKEVHVKTRMVYTVEVSPRWSTVRTAEDVGRYEYILEIDSEGKIIGGRWISEDRPDFLWRETTPEFRGYFAALQHIYSQSIK